MSSTTDQFAWSTSQQVNSIGAATVNDIKLVMTLLVRNEADIIEDNIRFHHAMGVDNFIVMDNLSTDATSDILQVLSKELTIEIISQTDDDYDQGVWVTHMARLAAQRYDADWVINSDADEFWLPAKGTLKSYLATIPDTVSRINVARYNAILEGKDGEPLAATAHPKRTILFERRSKTPLGQQLPNKCLHRANPLIEVGQGNHTVANISGDIINAGDDLSILHYPYRTLDAYRQKIALGDAAYIRNTRLSERIGATWREQYKTLEHGGIDHLWESLSRSSRDILIERLSGDLFSCDLVKNVLVKDPGILRDSSNILTDLLKATEISCRKKVEEIAHFIARTPKEIRPTRPLYYNIEFCANGPLQQVEYVKALIRNQSPLSELIRDFSAHRDAYSLFPSNEAFTKFFSTLLMEAFPDEYRELVADCHGKRVILHVSCQARADLAHKSINSFGDHEDFVHIMVVGQSVYQDERHTPLQLSYKNKLLTVPVPDSYEALHRKVFYAMMLLNLVARPRIVIKLDDNSHLDDWGQFLETLGDIEGKKSAYAGRAVGNQVHPTQWHGWHIGKCANQRIEQRGYQYPLPRQYAAGGYGYVLDATGLAACSYMYLAMQSFFDMDCIGLEDVFVGHAIGASGLTLHNVSTEHSILAFPGLVAI